VNATQAVVVNSAPTATSISGSATACTNQNGLIYSCTAQAGVTYVWTVPTGVTIASGQGTNSITTNWSASAVSGNVGLTISNSCGSVNASRAVVVGTVPITPIVSGNSSVCLGDNGVVYSTLSQVGATYNWIVPAGVTITNGQGTNSITTNWSTTAITGNICVIASNNCGSSNQSCATITVINCSVCNNPPSVNVGQDITSCGISTVSISAILGGAATTGTWSNGLGSFSPNSTSLNAVYTPTAGELANGVAKLIFTTNDPDGLGPCLAAIDTLQINLQSNLSTVSISGSIKVCRPTTSVTYSVPAVNGVSYAWTVPSGAIVSSGQGTNSITVNWTSTSLSGNVCVSRSNSCGAIQSCVAVNLTTAIPSRPNKMNGSAKACVGEARVYYVTTTASADNYVWTPPAGATINGSSVAVTVPDTAVTVVFGSSFTGDSVRVRTSNCKGLSTEGRSIFVALNTAIPVSPAVINGTSDNLCNVTSTVYSIAPVANAVNYTWTSTIPGLLFNGQVSPYTSPNVTVTVAFPISFTGTGTINVAAINGCGSSAFKSKTLSRSPAFPGNITGPSVVCSDLVGVNYSIAPISGATSYTWNVASGLTISSGQGTNAIAINFNGTSGSKYVRVTSNNSCTSSAVKNLILSVVVCARFDDQVQSGNLSLVVFPNPASEIIHYECEVLNAGKYQVQLFDLGGRIVMSDEQNFVEGSNQINWNTDGLPTGVYMLKVSGDEGTSTTRVIISK
jgi:hypothetical protein